MILFKKRWSKWFLEQKDVPQIKNIYASPMLGSYLISSNRVIVDIYKKTNLRTGIVKYKKIEK